MVRASHSADPEEKKRKEHNEGASLKREGRQRPKNLRGPSSKRQGGRGGGKKKEKSHLKLVGRAEKE